MTENDLISVIVPIFNIQNEIPRCVESIIRQTYSNLEIILVDDGSTDESRQVIDRLTEKDQRIKPVYKNNGGVTSARFAGIAAAKGEWIGFVDGDDEIEQDMYFRLLKNAKQYQADISHCGYQMCFSDGRIHYFHDTGEIIIQDSKSAIKELLVGERIEPGICNKLYHRSLFCHLLMTNPVDYNIRNNEDLLMNFYLFMEAKNTVFEDWCPYHYIVRYESASRGSLNHHKIFYPITVRQLILKDAPDELKDEATIALIQTLVNKYASLSKENETAFTVEKNNIRELLMKEKDGMQLVPERTRLLANMIIKAPKAFGILYPLYASYFQKKKYE